MTTTVLDAVVTAAATAAVAANPQAATVAPLVLGMLQTAMQLQSAGVMTPDQLAQLFADIGKGIASTHAQWIALDNAAKAP